MYFKHRGPDGKYGLYSRNNRRLLALLMFQAVRRDIVVLVPCCDRADACEDTGCFNIELTWKQGVVNLCTAKVPKMLLRCMRTRMKKEHTAKEKEASRENSKGFLLREGAPARFHVQHICICTFYCLTYLYLHVSMFNTSATPRFYV